MNTAVYKHLLSTYGRRPTLWLGWGLEFIRSILFRVVQALLVSQVASNLATGNIPGAKRYVLYFLMASLAGTIIGAISEFISINVENRVYEDLAVEYHSKLTGKDMAFYRDHQSGYLVSLFRQYLDSSMELVRFLRTTGIRTSVSLVLPAAVLLAVNLRLGLVAISVVIVQAIYIFWASAKTNVFRARSHEIYRKITGEVADLITNITAFKASGAEDRAQTRITTLMAEEIDTFWLRRKFDITYDLPRDLLTTLGITGAFFVVTMTPVGHSQSVGLIVLAITYMFQISRNVSDLPSFMTTLDNHITRAYPTLAYLSAEHETIRDPYKPHKLAITRGKIELENVSFSYSGTSGDRSIPVFKALNLTIRGGEQVGIVGLSGAGKSTLASLLMRFDDIDAGSIRIDGTNIRDVRQSDLRRRIAYVPQEPLLFHRTVRENIAYFDDRATQADVERAARAAHAQEFISRLPQGYDSMVGERGVKLSGGQKQRVAIARAVLKNAPIMLFDEATSALDTESERIIQQALPQILGRHTAIVIAHRLSTIAGLDRILVMHDGRIEEEGTHDQLLARDGHYASLWRKQVERRREPAPQSA